MIDLFANTCHLAVGAQLSNNILIVVTLSEGQGLVNRFSRVGDDLLQLQRTELVPLVLGGFQGNAMRVCSNAVFILEGGLRSRWAIALTERRNLTTSSRGFTVAEMTRAS